MRKISIYAFLVVITSLLAITISADGGYYNAKVENICKKENAECKINESGHSCCEGLTCIPFNGISGNGKCAKVVTNTPTITLTPTLTPTLTETPSLTPMYCEPVVVIGDCEYRIVEN